MIEQSPRTFFRSINLVFAIILVLGIGISAAVYLQGKQINMATMELVTNDLPTYAQFQQLRNQLTEQERHLYEYYASFDEVYYYKGYLEARSKAQEIVDALVNYFGPIEPLAGIIENQQRIDTLARAFDENMLLQPSGGTDWNLARNQLSEISQSMRSIAPHIETLTEITAKRVVGSQENVQSHLMNVNGYVVAYGFISLFIAYIVGRALKAYLSSSALSQRLALFPKRTPNPIITLNDKNQVTFANPATKRLLTRLGRDINDVESLLSEDLILLQGKIRRSSKNFDKIEYALDDLTMQCELHWLDDQKQWDIHLADVSAQKEAENKLQYLAYHHPETSLDNQYKFREVLESACLQNHPFSLGIVEIRSFTQLLATNSFEQVQVIVGQIARLLDKTCKELKDDLELYHIGDKNFALRIPSADCNQFIDKLVTHIRQSLKMAHFEGQSNIDLDFGFACFPQHGSSEEEIINHARIALDISASSEHSHYLLFSEQLGKKVKRQRDLQAAIRHAMDNHEFHLYFQPQYSLTKERIIGAEVLLRWQKDGNWIPPSEFIPLAERSGLIMELGDWILRSACQKARQLIDMGYPDLVVAVNISPKQFTSPNFVAKVEQALNESQLPAKNLELEITEGVIFKNESEAIQSLHQLKALGVMLAIDDFGTGYSSLSYLNQFPIDKLKIDRSFIHQMHKENADRSIVRTVIDLGNNLDLTLIAEGVEDEQQVEILRQMGCNEIQGFWYSKPLDEGYFVYFLQSQKKGSVTASRPARL